MNISKRKETIIRRLLTGCLALMLVFGLLAPMVGWAADDTGTGGSVSEDSNTENSNTVGIVTESGISDELDTENVVSDDDVPEDAAPKDVAYANLPEGAMPKMSLFTDDQYTKELAAGSELGLGGMIYVRFDWEGTLAGLTKDMCYRLFSLPENHLSSEPIFRTLYTDGTCDPIAKLEVDNAGIVSFTLLTDDANQVYGAYAGIGFALAADKSAANEKGQIEIKLPGMEDPVGITVKDFKPAPPKLTKSASNISAGGEVTWTIHYTAAASAYEGAIPVKLVDTLPEGMEYVASVSGAAIGTDAPVYDAQGHTLTWSLSEQADKTLTYQTKLTDAALSALWRDPSAARYENKVAGYDAEGASVDGLSANAAASVDESWNMALDKTGTYDQKSRTITWTVTVKPVRLNFAYLKVIDTMGKGLELNEADIAVGDGVKESGKKVSDYVATGSGIDSETEMTLWLYGGDGVTGGTKGSQNFKPNADGNYKITYSTKVSKDYFYQTSGDHDNPNGAVVLGDEDVQNSAILEWQWLDGDGAPGEETPPTVEKGPCMAEGLTNNLLSKSGDHYDPATHILTWNVTINASKQNITTADFQDLLADDGVITGTDGAKYKLGLAYEDTAALEQAIKTACSGSGVSVSSPVAFQKSESESDDMGKRNIGFTCTFSNVGAKTFTFPVQAEVIDASFWAANHSAGETSAINNATLSKVTLSDNTVLPRSFTASDSVSPYSNMLAKTHTELKLDSTDGARSGRVKWELTINENETSGLGSVTVTDTLPEGMSYVENSAELTVDDIVRVTGSGIKTEVNDHTVTWKFPEKETCDVNDREVKLTYWTEVDFDMVSDGEKAFLTKDSIGFENAAELVVSAAGITVTSGAISKATLDNTVLSKSQTLKGNIVSYKVTLNPYGISIASPADTQLYLEDRMPAGLALNLGSVKLYKVTPYAKKTNDSYSIGMDVKSTDSSPTNPDWYQVKKTDSGEIQNVLTIPVDDQTPYVLTYDAYIVQTNVELKNEISIIGSAVPIETGLSNAAAAVKLASFGGGKLLPPGNWALEVKKTDMAGKAITFTQQQIAAGKKPAVFGLYTAKSDDAKLLEAACDPGTGVCTFSQPAAVIKNADKLYLKELVPPTGYELNSEWLELTDGDVKNLQGKETVKKNVENKIKDENEPENPDTPGSGGGGESGGTGTPGGGGASGGGGTSGGGSVIPGDENTPADPEKPDSEKDPVDDKDDKDQKDDKEDKDDKDKNNSKPKPTKKPSKDKNSGKTSGSGKSDKTGGSKGTGGSQSTSGSKSASGTGKSGGGQGSGTNVSNAKSGAQGDSETVDGAKQPAIPQTGQNWYGVVMLALLGVIVLIGAAVISPLSKEQ